MFESVSAYIEARIALIKLEIKEEIAGVMARAMMALMLLFTFSMFFLFLNLGIALYLNGLFPEYPYLGFIIVAVFYLLVLLILIVLKKTIGLDKIIEDKVADILQKKEKKDAQQ
ncbi:MAG TPA: phage holin family protein [Cyclobacteriaceae bacterium]|nr:phage holin family protein [Cyclobacteriaceae bacterium]